MQQQADSDQKNRHKEKLIDLAIGEHMNNDAMEVMRQQREFLQAKKEIARQACTSTWDE
jgi:hypothetical protein